MAARIITYREAIREAIQWEMRRDPSVILIGEDVAGGAATHLEEAGRTPGAERWASPKASFRSSGGIESSIPRSARQLSSARPSVQPRPVCDPLLN